MRHLCKTICVALVASAMALPASAQQQAQRRPAPQAERPVVMLCQFTEATPSGWIPDVVIITRQASGRIEVFDPILQALVGKPIAATVTSDTRREKTYGWALAGVRNASGQWAERLDYRLVVRKSDGDATIVMQAKDYDNTLIGSGVCGQPTQ